MPINTKSIRTKMLGLLAFIALVVGGVSVVYDLRAGGALIRDEIVKRGRYVASNLAFNAKYGVLTEDKPLLTQFLEGASAPGVITPPGITVFTVMPCSTSSNALARESAVSAPLDAA